MYKKVVMSCKFLIRISIIYYIFFCVLPLNAQECEVKGVVLDENGGFVEFASVGLYADSIFFAGALTDASGHFAIPATCKNSYIIKVKCIGYSLSEEVQIVPGKEQNVIAIKMMTLDNALKEVLVQSKRSVIERRADRLIYFVDTSFLAANRSALEVLSTAPSVWVDGNGKLRINGREGVQVMVNGKILKMSGLQLQNYLNGLPGEQIDRIEIIAVPGAEHDAANKGGVINIVLKKKFLDGFQSNLFAGYEQGLYPEYSTGIFSNYKKEKLTVTANFYIFERNMFLDRTEVRDNPSTAFFLKSRSFGKMKVNNNQVRLGAEYEVSNNQSAGFEYVRTFNLNTFDVSALTSISQNLQPGAVNGRYLTNSRNIYQGSVFNYAWNIDTLGSFFKILADYIHNNNKSGGIFDSDYYNDADVFQQNITKRNNLDQISNIYSAQIDYNKSFSNKTNLSAGLKFNKSNIQNDLVEEDLIDKVFVVNPERINQFEYNEEIAASYLSITGACSALQYKAGLRLENAVMKSNSINSIYNFKINYLDWFPSFSLLWEFGKDNNNAFTLGGNRKIARPDFEALSPFVYSLNEFTILKGNPNLRPEYTYNLDLGYAFMNEYSIDAYISRTNDIMNRVLLANEEVSVYQVKNLSRQTSYGVSASIPVSVVKGIWRANTYVSIFNTIYSADLISESKATFVARFNHAFNFKNNLRANIAVNYSSKELYANLIYDAYWQANISVSRTFMKERLTLSLGAQDIFRTKNNNTRLTDALENIRSLEVSQTQKIQLYLFYRLNIGKSFNKKETESSASGMKSRMKS